MTNKNILTKFFTLISVFGMILSSNAATKTTVANGLWHVGATWGGTVPVAGDDVIIHHRIDVTPITGAISMNSLIIENNVADADMHVTSGTTVTVTGDVNIRIGVFNFFSDLLLYAGSDMQIGGNFSMVRSSTNANAERMRLFMTEASKLSCGNDFLVQTRGTGSNGATVDIRANCTVDITGQFNLNHQGGTNLNVTIDSTDFTAGGTTFFTVNGASATDLNITLSGTTILKVPTIISNLALGDDLRINVNEDAQFIATGHFRQLHSGGDIFAMNVRNDASVTISGNLEITHSASTHTNNIDNNGAVKITGNYILTKSGGTGTTLRLRNNATLSMVNLDLDITGGAANTINLEDKAELTISGDLTKDIAGTTGNTILDLIDTTKVTIGGDFFVTQTSGSNQEVEINGESSITITGDYIVNATGGTNQNIDINGGTMNVSGSNGVDFDIDGTSTAGSVDLSGSYSTLDIKTGNFQILNKGTHTYSVNNNAGKILVAGFMTMTNEAQSIICNMNNGAKLDVKGGHLSFLNNTSSTGDINIDFNNADVDVSGRIRIFAQSATADDALFDVLGASTVDCGALEFVQTAGNGVTSVFTTNFRGTSIINCGEIQTINNSAGAFNNIFGGDADINITNNLLATIGSSAGALYAFRTQDNATMDIGGTVTIDKDGGTSAVFAADDTAIVTVTGNVLFDVDGGTSVTKLDATQDATINLMGDLTMDQDGGTSSIEIEANNSSDITITGNALLDMSAGSATLVDLDNTAIVTINGATGLTINSFNGTVSSSINLNTGSTLDIVTGGLIIDHNTAAATSNFNVEINNGSTLKVKKNVDYTLTQGHDATFNIGNGTGTFGADININDLGLRDDCSVSFSGSDVDVAGDINFTNSSAGITNADCSFGVTDSSDFDLVGNLNIIHNEGRDFNVNFSGNADGGSMSDIGGNIILTRNGATARNLRINVTGSVGNSGTLTVVGDVTIQDNGTNVAGQSRLYGGREGIANLNNLNLNSVNAGNDVRLRTDNSSQFSISGNLVINVQQDGDCQLDLNHTSDLFLGGGVTRTSGFGNLQMAQNTEIHFNGTAVQEIPSRDVGVVDLFRYTNIELNNPAGFTMGAGGAEMTDTLTLTNGILTTTSTNILTFANTRAWAMGASTISHISGPVRKIGVGAFIFPLGKGGDLGQFAISDGGNSQNFTVEFFNTPYVNTTSMGAGVNNVSVLEHWLVTKTGGNDITVTPHWNDAYFSGINNLSDLFVAHFDGANWISEGSGGTTGGILHNPGTVLSGNLISSFSPITFGSATPGVNPLGPGLMETIKDGNWNDPLTWDINLVPTATHMPIVWHNVNIQSSTAAVAMSVEMYNDTTNCEIDMKDGSSLTVGSYLQAASGNENYHLDLLLDNAQLNVADNILFTRKSTNTTNRRARMRAINSAEITCDTFQYNYMGSGTENSNEIAINSNSTLTINNDLVLISHMNATRSLYVNSNGGSIRIGGKARNSIASANTNDIIYNLAGTGSFSVADSFIVNQQGGDDFRFTSNGVRTNTFSGPIQMDISGGDESSMTFRGTSTNIFNGDFIVNQTGGDNSTINFMDSSTNTLGFFGLTNAGGDNVIANFRHNSVTNIGTTIGITHSGGDNVNINSDEFADVNINANIILTKTGGLDFGLNVRDTSTMDVNGEITILNMAGVQDARIRTYQDGELTVRNDIFMNNVLGKDNMVQTNQTSKLVVNGNLAMNIDGGENLILDLNGTSEIEINGAGGLNWNLFNTTARSEIRSDSGSSLRIRADADINHQDVVGMQDFRWISNGGTVRIGGDLDYNSSGGDDAFFIFNRGAILNVGNDLLLTANNLNDDLVFNCDSCDLDVANDMTITGTNGADATRVIFNGNATVDILGDLTMNKRSGTSNSHINATGNIRGGATVNVGGDINMNNLSTHGNLLLYVQGYNLDHTKSSTTTVTGDVNMVSQSFGFNTRLLMQEGGQLNATNVLLDYNGAGSYVEMEMSHASNAVISGNLTLDATTSGDVRLDMNNTSVLCLGGAIVRANNFGALQAGHFSTIKYDGSAVQTIAAKDLGAGDIWSHANIVIDNAAGFVTGAGGSEVRDTMTFTNGIVTSTAADVMEFATSGSTPFAKDFSYFSHVNGPVVKDGAGAFKFPTGKAGIAGPIEISDPGNAGEFTAEYFRTTPIDTATRVATLTNISAFEYWDLDRTAGNNVYVTLYWTDAGASGITNGPDLRVAHYDAGTPIWEDLGQGSISGSLGWSGQGQIRTLNLVSSFSPFSFGSNNASPIVNPLPVSLINFNAKLIDQTTSQLTWQTASEVNNDHFDVERSFDGLTFSKVGEVAGANNSDELLNYTFMDTKLSEAISNIVYYRLKMVEKTVNIDGSEKAEYSKVRSLYLDKTLHKDIVIYPNPAVSNINIDWKGSESETLKVEITNINGQKVYESTFKTSETNGSVNVDLSNLKSGVYFIGLNDGESTQRTKLIISK